MRFSATTRSSEFSSRAQYSLKKAIPDLARAVENDMDVCVPCFPGIAKQIHCFSLESGGSRVAQPIHRFSKGLAPLLAPPRLSAGITAAITVPPFNSVRTSPCGTLPDLGFMCGRMLFEIFAVIG